MNYTQPFTHYPTPKDHEQAWKALAHNIAQTRDQITEYPEPVVKADGGEPKAQTTGELTIIGSGIETVGFTTRDEALIQSADKVFYCVADPATVVWLKARRPDAYDLYVLYDDTKIRYVTYMQMTEAMLYYVRQGQKVLGIYYGHPGIFVLSSHRAIKIARREGYRATMRASVSALDTLCADLGVDPSQPGMQTFEATDMLIRARQPDTSLHVVLWQVGLIGELGYRRGGYMNSNFSVLIEYLQRFYGDDYPVTNYIGSRYPGIEPTTTIYTLKQLHDPEVQSQVTGISTFYLAPQRAATADLAMMERLGMIQPGMKPKNPETSLRQIDRYGDREMTAFQQFETFEIPKGYHWQADTAAARFILALRDDVDLCDRYVHHPQSAMTEERFPGLSDQEKALLSTQDAGSMQFAAKGLNAHRSINRALLQDILCNKPLAKSLHRTVNQLHRSVLTPALEQWASEQGYTVDWARMQADFVALARQRLYSWSGIYLSHTPQWMILVLGSKRDRRFDRVYVNDNPVKNLRFQHGRLQWSSQDGNAHNGYVYADLAPNGRRRLAGTIWPDGATVPAHHNFVAPAVRPQPLELCHWVGDYDLESPSTSMSICLGQRSHHPPMVEVYRDERPVLTPVKVDQSGLKVDEWLIPWRALKPAEQVPPCLQTEYTVRSAEGSRRSMHRFEVTEGSLKIDGQPVREAQFSHNQVTWSGGTSPFDAGKLEFLVDPISLLPMCFGRAGCDHHQQSLSLTGMKPALAEPWGTTPAPSNWPDWAWEYLLSIIHRASDKGGLFVWSAWERHTFTH
ncbi:MAG: SAM-dependent methyltransferase, partial [Cyanobacteria bacterium P01_E01_bin.43]